MGGPRGLPARRAHRRPNGYSAGPRFAPGHVGAVKLRSGLANVATAADHGGVAARRAVVRWSWRLLRREWREQLLVVALLTATVAAAVGFATAAYNLAPVPGNADFGTGSHSFVLVNPDPDGLPATVAAARQEFGAVDAIAHRTDA